MHAVVSKNCFWRPLAPIQLSTELCCIVRYIERVRRAQVFFLCVLVTAQDGRTDEWIDCSFTKVSFTLIFFSNFFLTHTKRMDETLHIIICCILLFDGAKLMNGYVHESIVDSQRNSVLGSSALSWLL